MLNERVSIKNSSRVTKKDKVTKKYEQYIFKSHKERFQHPSSTNTPSPGDYELQIDKRQKTLDYSYSRSKLDNSSLRQSTLPTIPDKRNKYGINLDDISYVDKSEEQLSK
jgi:hypothetical protein